MWILLCLLGLTSTHIYRSIIKKHNWLNLSLSRIIPRILISSFIIGSVVYGIVFSTEIIFDLLPKEEFNPAAPLIGITNMGSIILLWSLIYFSLHYFENYKRVEIESLIWEAAVKDFELKTLKSQLNPHFMFNAMNSIRALIEEDPVNAKNAITKLSNILRYSLRIDRTETVPLEDEIQTVEDYLALEKIRFEERLKYKIFIAPSTCKIEIPPMMIQTLVENGIKHGISKLPEGGEVSLTSNIEKNHLVIRIENSGFINEEDVRNSKGFGISNTKHRLNLLFGEDAFFNISNKSDKKVLTELIIPLGARKNESFNS
ncbi:MAG: histidine kinase [Ignavibacteriaceae bacterium]|nr:histidine kinase [Ignavibacteriaceae bacterium]